MSEPDTEGSKSYSKCPRCGGSLVSRRQYRDPLKADRSGSRKGLYLGQVCENVGKCDWKWGVEIKL